MNMAAIFSEGLNADPWSSATENRMPVMLYRLDTFHAVGRGRWRLGLISFLHCGGEEMSRRMHRQWPQDLSSHFVKLDHEHFLGNNSF